MRRKEHGYGTVMSMLHCRAYICTKEREKAEVGKKNSRGQRSSQKILAMHWGAPDQNYLLEKPWAKKEWPGSGTTALLSRWLDVAPGKSGFRVNASGSGGAATGEGQPPTASTQQVPGKGI